MCRPAVGHSSHPIGRKITTPTTGFKVQPSEADGRSKGAVFQSSRSRPCSAGRPPMKAVHVRCSISRTGTADPLLTFAENSLSVSDAAVAVGHGRTLNSRSLPLCCHPRASDLSGRMPGFKVLLTLLVRHQVAASRTSADQRRRLELPTQRRRWQLFG